MFQRMATATLTVMLFPLFSFHPILAGDATPRVLVIGIDGCRPDALQRARTPNLDALSKAGIYFSGTDIRKPEATDKADTISGPGWSNLLTGVWPDKHNVMKNEFNDPHYEQFPHVFKRLKQSRPDAVTASFSTWEPIESKIVTDADVSRSFHKDPPDYEGCDREAVSACVAFLKTKDPDLVFLYQGAVDPAGHTHGFHPTVPEYISAIEAVDKNLGDVVSAIRGRPDFGDEDWLIIVCTDHGGRGTGHGGGHTDPDIRTTFLIVSGDNAEKGTSDAPTWQVDVVATALAHLNIAIPEEWGLDGRAVGLKQQAVDSSNP